MSKKDKLEEFEYILNKIDNEGLGYYIMDYTSAESMPDSKSKKLFEKAEFALLEFTSYIKSKCEELK